MNVQLSSFVLIYIPGLFSLALSSNNSDKVNPQLKSKLTENSGHNVIVTFDTTTTETLSHVRDKLRSIKIRPQKFQAIVQALEGQAKKSQTTALETLQKARSIKYHVLWITNQIYIFRATEDLIHRLAELKEVTKIDEDNLKITPDPPEATAHLLPPKRPPHPRFGQLTWGIENMKVPEVWSQGYYGQDVVVANIDTGVAFHDANRDNFIGLDNFGLFQPESGSYFPVPEGPGSNHGTHVMGTISGHLGIGVAPGAKWMACQISGKNTNAYYASFIQCFQHFLCPGRLNNTEKVKCGIIPQIISNSWGFSPLNDKNKELLSAIKAFEGTGTHIVFAASNDGPGCSSMGYPASLPSILSVGALNTSNQVAIFSSSGPGHNDSIMKPDVVAPGVSVMSAGLSNNYFPSAGTSMACPHAAGVMALMLSKNPGISEEEMMAALIKSGEPTVPEGGAPIPGCDFPWEPCPKICDKLPLDTYPNYRAGYGRINALKAINFIDKPK